MRYTDLGTFLKGFLILFALFSVSAVLSAEEMERYRNDEIGFALDIPITWFVTDGGIQEGVIISSTPDFQDANRDIGVAFGIILIPDYCEGMELNQLWQNTAGDMDEDVTEPNPIMFGEFEGLWGKIRNTEKDLSGEIYISIGLGKAYMVLTVIHPSSELEQTYSPILDKMVKTLEFFE